MFRWLSGDSLTRSSLEADGASGLSLYDMGGPFLLLAAVVSAVLAASVARQCIRRRRTSLDRLPGAKLVTKIHYYVGLSFVVFARVLPRNDKSEDYERMLRAMLCTTHTLKWVFFIGELS